VLQDFNKSIHLLSPPPSSPLAPIKSRMEAFWYRLTQVHLESGPLKQRGSERERERERERDVTYFKCLRVIDSTTCQYGNVMVMYQ